MPSTKRVNAALDVRDTGLAILRKFGKPEPEMRGCVSAQRGELVVSVRTPFFRLPEPSEYNKYRAASMGLVFPKNLPYGLDVWAPRKVLNIEWDDHERVELVSFKPGAWQLELQRWLVGEWDIRLCQ